MLNERDGGIGGVKLVVDECETGYDTKKGLECYDSVKPKNPVIVNPWSTGITLSLIPKASVDKIPILSMAYGLSASAKGDVFPWMFNPPVNLLGRRFGNPQICRRRLDRGAEGQDDRLSLFRRRVRPGGAAVLPALAKDVGFDLKLYPVAPADMQNQSSKWLDIRRDKPDFLVMYGWGAMNADRDQGSGQGGIPDGQVRLDLVAERCRTRLPPATARRASRSSTGTAPARTIPRFADIKKLVIDAGKSQTPKDEFGQVLYDRGVYNSMLIAEAIAEAQKITGKKVVTGEDVRRGLENIDLDDARLKAIGLEGFASAGQADLRRPQQPLRDLRPAMGRREMGEGQRPDRPGSRRRCSRCSTRPPRPTPRRTPAGPRAPRPATTSEAKVPSPLAGEGRRRLRAMRASRCASRRASASPNRLPPRSSTSSTSRSSTIQVALVLKGVSLSVPEGRNRRAARRQRRGQDDDPESDLQSAARRARRSDQGRDPCSRASASTGSRPTNSCAAARSR